MDFFNNALKVYWLFRLFEAKGLKFPYIPSIHPNHEEIVKDTFQIANFIRLYTIKQLDGTHYLLEEVKKTYEKTHWIHIHACFNGFAKYANIYEQQKRKTIQDIVLEEESKQCAHRSNKFNKEMYFSNILVEMRNQSA